MLRADAIVVLGCRIGPSGRPTAPLARRAAAGAGAYLVGSARWIIASGGRRWGAHIEARAISRELVRAGVPEAAVVEELCSLTTYENALFSAEILRRLGARRAAIATCPWHMTRALASFRAAGVDACALPARGLPASIPSRAYLRAHEIVCGWIDAYAMRRGDLLTEHAGAQFAALRGGGDARVLAARPEPSAP